MMHEGRRVSTTSSSPMRAVANHQMDSTSLTFDRFVSMNCSPDPGPSTSATFVCTSASGACVIVTNTPSPRMSRPPPSRLRRPHGLCAFVQKPLVADAVVQQADLQRWVDANRIDPPQMSKWGGWELLCRVFRKSHLRFLFSGVLRSEVTGIVVDVRL